MLARTETNGLPGATLCSRTVATTPRYGPTIFEANVGFNQPEAVGNATVNGTVDQIDFNQYNYHNASVNGTLDKKLFNGSVKLNDENVKVDFAGLVALVEGAGLIAEVVDALEELPLAGPAPGGELFGDLMGAGGPVIQLMGQSGEPLGGISVARVVRR